MTSRGNDYVNGVPCEFEERLSDAHRKEEAKPQAVRRLTEVQDSIWVSKRHGVR